MKPEVITQAIAKLPVEQQREWREIHRTPLRSCRIVAKFATKDSKGNMVGTEYYAAWDYQNGKHFLPADHRSPRRIVSLVVCSEQKGVMVMNEGDAEYLSENRAVRGW